MNTTRGWAALAAALLLACPLLLAQPQTGDQNPQDRSRHDTAAGKDAAPPPTPIAATAPEDGGAKPPPRREDSPFDYRSSEQISEDLSVSFPVDI